MTNNKPKYEKYYKCSMKKCKLSDELIKERDEKIDERLAKIEEMKRLHSHDIMRMYKELKAISDDYLKDMKKWKNYEEINIHKECIKKNCKTFLILFIKSCVPFLQEQIKFLSVLVNIKSLEDDKKELFKKAIEQINIKIKSIKNIKKWTDEQFDEVLYSLFTVKDINKLFSF